MKLNDCLYVLEIYGDVMGRPSVVYPSVLKDGDDLILVDTGYPEERPLFEAAFSREGLSLANLTGILLTHQDLDHTGSFKNIVQHAPKAVKVMAHEIEKPYIDGTQTPVKLAQLEAALPVLPPERRAFYDRLKLGFRHCQAPVDVALKDGEGLPFCGGVTVIHTPGHTPGHICLYHAQSKTLIAGDAVLVRDGQVSYNDPIHNQDQALYHETLQKLLLYDIETLVSYHGGVCGKDVMAGLRKLTEAKI